MRSNPPCEVEASLPSQQLHPRHTTPESSPASQPSRGLASIHRVHMPRGERRVVRRQIRKQPRNLLRRGVPPQRNLLIHFLQHRVRIFPALHRRQHVSRSHGAHPHLRRQLQRHRPRQLNHSR